MSTPGTGGNAHDWLSSSVRLTSAWIPLVALNVALLAGTLVVIAVRRR